MKLSIFSVVKNEEAMIEDMLKSAQGADEHIILDTGSTDKTIEICKKYTDKVFTDYVWNDNFSEAKNLAMSRCTGDWIMGLDADCRLEPDGIAKIRKMIESTTDDVLNVRVVHNKLENSDKFYHTLPKIFRANAGIQYIGKVHETVNKQGKGNGDVTIIYLYSPNHFSDPERNIRILLSDDMEKPRTLFYLGREYFERKRYDEALKIFFRYIPRSKWLLELAEAYLCVAKCYWFTKRGALARKYGFEALKLNPDFGEVYRFLSETHNEPWKSKWREMGKHATNKDVLFVRK